MTNHTQHSVYKEGGKWLGALRTSILCSSNLRWGSDDQIKGMTVKELEQMCAAAVAADRNAREDKTP